MCRYGFIVHFVFIFIIASFDDCCLYIGDSRIDRVQSSTISMCVLTRFLVLNPFATCRCRLSHVPGHAERRSSYPFPRPLPSVATFECHVIIISEIVFAATVVTAWREGGRGGTGARAQARGRRRPAALVATVRRRRRLQRRTVGGVRLPLDISRPNIAESVESVCWREY